MYVLRQRIHVHRPPLQHEATVYFVADSPEQLDYLVGVYQKGGIDGRIIEAGPPSDVYEGGFSVEVVSFTGPDGQVLEWNQ